MNAIAYPIIDSSNRITRLNIRCLNSNLSSHRQFHQLPKVRHPQSSNRIPPRSRVPARVRNDPRATGNWLACLTIYAVAAHGATSGDVGETLEADAVEPGVKVAELLFTGPEAGVVQEGDDGGENRGGGGGAT